VGLFEGRGVLGQLAPLFGGIRHVALEHRSGRLGFSASPAGV